MRNAFLFCFLTTLLLFENASIAQNQITLDEVFKKGTFRTMTVPAFNFTPDGRHYTTLEKEGIVEWNMDATRNRSLFDLKNHKQNITQIDGYELSKNQKQLLLFSNAEPLYRHSALGQYHVFDIPTQTLRRVKSPGPAREAKLSPDGTGVAFVSLNNLYIYHITSDKLSAVTSDGKTNAIINGAADWVYEEEFGQSHYFEWSPDGRYIAFVRFDESKVPTMTIEYHYDSVYPQLNTYKYPKVGQNNSVVTAHIFDTKTRKLRQVPLEGTDFYIPRIKWADNNRVVVFQLNRLQNDLKLWLADANNVRKRLLYRETETEYIDIHDNLTFLPDNAGFLWTAELDGYNHIYHFNMQGQLVRQLTQGAFDVTAFYGYDPDKKEIHCQAALPTPLDRTWMTVSLTTGTSVNKSASTGWNDYQFSPNFAYYLHNYSTVNSPNFYTLRNLEGTYERVLEDNAALKQKQSQYAAQPVEFFDVPATALRPHLHGWMIKPPGFDTKKQYPVFMYLYGGPGSQEVVNQWGAWHYWWFQYLAQQGYIIACVDNRGTGARGEQFKKCTYKQLGKLETEDQIAAGRYLSALPYVDSSRIGIFGWSYGGYMSSLCLFIGNDVFKAGLAVAPVTNWKWYDSIYTERYMQTDKENAAGYRDNSPVTYAGRLKGHYFLAHGIADDNVHFQNAVEMIEALLKANKDYTFYMYPNRNHGIYGGNARVHLFTRMTEFILEKL